MDLSGPVKLNVRVRTRSQSAGWAVNRDPTEAVSTNSKPLPEDNISRNTHPSSKKAILLDDISSNLTEDDRSMASQSENELEIPMIAASARTITSQEEPGVSSKPLKAEHISLETVLADSSPAPAQALGTHTQEEHQLGHSGQEDGLSFEPQPASTHETARPSVRFQEGGDVMIPQVLSSILKNPQSARLPESENASVAISPSSRPKRKQATDHRKDTPISKRRKVVTGNEPLLYSLEDFQGAMCLLELRLAGREAVLPSVVLNAAPEVEIAEPISGDPPQIPDPCPSQNRQATTSTRQMDSGSESEQRGVEPLGNEGEKLETSSERIQSLYKRFSFVPRSTCVKNYAMTPDSDEDNIVIPRPNTS
ncbi:hypothetical protein BD324DRAFT_653766 [Kockovaella imperatae]|uniref:Uncharacterized protein n=1 Tax=Kockovaella imperatae TaxID=4999 RepID=A0A1Y1U992_9TREE|nr:hypothetical protein BD324DRAFT_653766 [Kockovaella imperatae]ORX34076.1 hypothetical protein BD324DRAFT_653766 [Kockovaella imperatae]